MNSQGKSNPRVRGFSVALLGASVAAATLACMIEKRVSPPASAATKTALRAGGSRDLGGVAKVSEATGFFRVEKINNRWVFITPDGAPFWMIGVFNVNTNGSNNKDLGTIHDQEILKKHGTRAAWGLHTVRRLLSWGFNTLAEMPLTWAMPFHTSPEKMPVVNMIRPSWYGLTNRWNYAPGPFKSLGDCLDSSVYTGYVGNGPPDVYDPNFDAYVDGTLGGWRNDSFWGQLLTSPWSMGTTMDDADELQGFGPGPESPGPNGIVTVHIGWLALSASPEKASSAKYGVTYPNPTVYTKKALRDFLAERYGNDIAALNSAWGSNYTTFDSAGGWGAGSGLMDENGRHTAWLGRRDGKLRDAAPGVVSDLDDFLYEYARKYFSTVAARLRQYSPNHLVWCPASLNGHYGLSRRQVLRAAGEYCDVVQAAMTPVIFDKTAEYVGDRPIVTWEGFVANPDSSLWRYPNPAGGSIPVFNTQTERGAAYADKLSYLFDATSSAGIKPIAGIKLWELVDNWGEKINWGLLTFYDNAYDGTEARVAIGADAWDIRTGGEERDYNDFLSLVRQANLSILQRLGEEMERRKEERMSPGKLGGAPRQGHQ